MRNYQGNIMKTVLVLIIIQLITLLQVAAQAPDTLWTKTFGGSNSERGQTVVPTSDGGFAIFAHTYSFGPGHFWLIKTDPYGDTLWTKHLVNSNFQGGSLIETSEKGFILVGTVYTSGPNTLDLILIKTNSLGNVVWTKVFEGGGNEYGHHVDQTFDGGFIVIGSKWTITPPIQSDIWLLKMDPNGDTLWTKTFGRTGDDRGGDVRQTSDSGYVLVGQTDSYGAGSYDLWLIKTDQAGDTLWTKLFGGSNSDTPGGIQQTMDGGYIIAGVTFSFGIGGDLWLIKTNSSGVATHTKTYGGSSNDFGNSIRQTSDSGFVVTGSIFSSATLYDLWILKTNQSLDTVWTKRAGGSGNKNDVGASVSETADRGYIITGYTASFGAGMEDSWLLRIRGTISNITDIDLQPSWNILSIPRSVFDFCTSTLFPTATSSAFAYGATGYVAKDTLANGAGYWLKFSSGQTVSISGQARTLDTISVNFGWNMIGSISSPVSVANILSVPAGIVTSSFFGYNISYVIADSIRPGHGYWVKVNQAGQLILSASSQTPQSARIKIIPTSELPPSLPSDIEHLPSDIPHKFALEQNYPNPFNPLTVVRFQLPVESKVTLKIYNVLGQEVAVLVDEMQAAGYKSVEWNAENVPSGVYFYRLMADKFIETKKLIITK